MTIRAWAEFADSKNRADILRQLQDLGYEISQRTFYRHCAQGKCRTGKGGMFTRRLVKAYVEAEGLFRHGEDLADLEGPNSALSVEKQKLENEKLRIHNQTAELEFRRKAGLLIEREALYLELSARAVALDNGFRQMIEVEAPALIVALGGDPARQPEFTEAMLAVWNDLLNSYASTEEFEVLFENDETPVGEAQQ